MTLQGLFWSEWIFALPLGCYGIQIKHMLSLSFQTLDEAAKACDTLQCECCCGSRTSKVADLWLIDTPTHTHTKTNYLPAPMTRALGEAGKRQVS